MYQTLYRKYRPRVFDDVCGQEHITSVLRYEAEHSRFSHAYLFCGSRGTGKTSCAKILAKVLNCEHPVNGNPCGECFSCRSIDEGNSTDVLEMDAASRTGVDYIRDIQDEISFAPTSLKKRVYIIDEVHMLSVGAFNALLKTLEEPPEHAVFILATTEFHKLPATIISRCQRFDFRRIDSDVIAARLLYIAGQENISLTSDAAKVIAKQSFGGMRDAISLFELCSAGGCDVTVERVSDILGLTGIETLYKTAVAVSRGDIASIFTVVKEIVSSTKDIAVFWNELTGFWRDMMVLKYLPKEQYSAYLDYTEPEMNLLKDASRRFKSETLSYQFNLLDEATKDINRLPQTKRMTAELTLIKMSDPSLMRTNSALLSRIAALEEKVVMLESGVVSVKPAPEKADAMQDTESAEQEKSSESSENTLSAEKKMRLIPDISDVVERLSTNKGNIAALLSQSDCYISESGDELVIRTQNPMAKIVLSRDEERKSLLTAFMMCKFCGAGTSLSIESGEIRKRPEPIDELQTF